MRVVLAAVRAAVRTIGVVRTIGAVRIRRALIGHITVGARLDAFTTGVVTTFSGCVASLLTRTV